MHFWMSSGKGSPDLRPDSGRDLPQQQPPHPKYTPPSAHLFGVHTAYSLLQIPASGEQDVYVPQ